MARHVTWHGMAWLGRAQHGMAWPPFAKASQLGWASCTTRGAPSPAPPHAMGAVSAGPPGRAYRNLPTPLPWGHGSLGGTRPSSSSEPPKPSPHAPETGGSPAAMSWSPARRCPTAGHPHHSPWARRCPPLPNRCCSLFLAGSGAVRGAPRVPSPTANPSSPTANPSAARCGQGAGRQPPSPMPMPASAPG